MHLWSVEHFQSSKLAGSSKWTSIFWCLKSQEVHSYMKSYLRKARFRWKHKKAVHFWVFDNKIPVGSIFPLFFLNVWLHRFCFLEVSPWEILLYSQKEISAKLWIVHMIPLFTLFWTKLTYNTYEFVSKWRCKMTDIEFAWTYILFM